MPQQRSYKKVLKQGAFLFGMFLFAAALQSFAFTEPSDTPPLGDAYAPVNTGPNVQIKKDEVGHQAWIGVDGIAAYYGAILAANGGSVGVGTAAPATKLDVNGAVKVGNTTAACTSGLAGAMRWNGTTMEVCNGTAWGALGGTGSTADLCSVSGTLIGGKTYSACCSAGGTVTSIGGGSYVCKFTGTSCKTGWTKYQNWTTTSSYTCSGMNACGGSNCSTGAHGFSNTATESCAYEAGNINGQATEANGTIYCGGNPYPGTCYALLTEVGCQ